ncbi:lipase 1-like [Sitodiplosis mosellana]|uniref:lipase 1-like n=1 Tax=Sitodiplosis mosellana TaxID=263140 RepID=UPI0024446B0C|nr:lipase 1-like [Sitodiplosis mosellana]
MKYRKFIRFDCFAYLKVFFAINIIQQCTDATVQFQTFSRLKMELNRTSLVLTLVHIALSPIVEAFLTQNPVTQALCGLRTDQLIKYYGYEAEIHKVTTHDGYILTLFRCNSKNSSLSGERKSVIVQHGLLVSSDDFCINVPSQALAYVLADAGYDIWLPNFRGSYYSRNHVSEDPNDLFGGYWNFSWYEMGIYDHPAVIDYILKETGNEKLYYIGYSQGSTSIMVLLSEKPEYNAKIYAASLMAPAVYMAGDGPIYQILSRFAPILQGIASTEFLPRSDLISKLLILICSRDLNLCNAFVDLICGLSLDQRNNTMLPAFVCHIPSGASLKQIIHYGQEIKYGFFGKYKYGVDIPEDFPLHRITAPISIHYSVADTLANARDARILISKLKTKDLYSQEIQGQFNHIDFVWGMNSASLIYTKILQFFDKYQ